MRPPAARPRPGPSGKRRRPVAGRRPDVESAFASTIGSLFVAIRQANEALCQRERAFPSAIGQFRHTLVATGSDTGGTPWWLLTDAGRGSN